MEERIQGVVVWFKADLGYGFIQPNGGGKQIFVHHSAIVADGYRTLQEGQTVTFVVERGQKGPQAMDVKVVE